MNLSIMKVEVVVFGVMPVVTINCVSILPGLIIIKPLSDHCAITDMSTTLQSREAKMHF